MKHQSSTASSGVTPAIAMELVAASRSGSPTRSTRSSRSKADRPLSDERVLDHVHDVDCSDATLVFAISGDAIAGVTRVLRSDDADVQLVDARHGRAAGCRGGIVHTVDGGDTWQVQRVVSTDTFAADLTTFHMLDLERGFAADDEGHLIITHTGGLQPWSDSHVTARERALPAR
jgi:hypothetical protein